MPGKIKIRTPFSPEHCTMCLEALDNKVMYRKYGAHRLVVKIEENSKEQETYQFELRLLRTTNKEFAPSKLAGIKGEIVPDGGNGSEIRAVVFPRWMFWRILYFFMNLGLFAILPILYSQATQLEAILKQLFTYHPDDPEAITNAYIQQVHQMHTTYLERQSSDDEE